MTVSYKSGVRQGREGLGEQGTPLLMHCSSMAAFSMQGKASVENACWRVRCAEDILPFSAHCNCQVDSSKRQHKVHDLLDMQKPMSSGPLSLC